MPIRKSRFPALVAGLLVLAAGVTCTEGPTSPKNSLARIGIAPVFSQDATEIYRNLLNVELAINNVRVRLERANGDVAIDTVVTIGPGQDSVVLNLSVPLEGVSEELEATIELRNGEVVLFSGTRTITARAGFSASQPEPIPVVFTGPGATVTTLDVNPDTTITGVDDIQMRVVGRDANNLIVPDIAVTWSVSPAGLGTITPGGLFNPTGTRGTATVTALVPTGVSASATVAVIPPPTQVVLVSGSGQSGTVGTALSAPFVVEVRAADGGPVPGHAVSFVVTAGGGSVSVPDAITGADGRASTSLTLGTTAGTNSVEVTAAGLTPISASATGTPGNATQLAIAQQPSATTQSGELLGTQPQVQLQDAFGNNVSTANVAVRVTLIATGGYTISGTITVNTNASGIAVFTNLRISGPSGTTALGFSSTGLTSVTSQNIVVGVAAVSWINTAGGNWSTGANWSTGVAPGLTDNVVINAAGTYTVTLDVNPNVASLSLGGASGTQTLTGTSRTVTVNGINQINTNGVLTLTTGQLAGAGAVVNAGTVVLQAVTINSVTTFDNQATATFRGSSIINGALVTSASSIILVEGTPSASTGLLTVTTGFTNNGLIELTALGGHASQLTVTNNALTNASGGTIRSAAGQSGGGRTLTAQLANQGTLDVDHALTLSKTDADHTSSGTVDISSSNLTVTLSGITPSFANTGSVTIGATRTWSVSGGLLDLSAGTVVGTTGSRLIVTGGTLAFSTATVSVALTVQSTAIVGGSVTVPNGQTLELFGGGLNEPVTVASGGTLLVHGAVTLSNTLSIPSGGAVLIEGTPTTSTGALSVSTGFTNSGTIDLTSQGGHASSLTVTGGAFTNAGMVRSLAASGGSRTLNAVLQNSGTLQVDHPLSMDGGSGASVNSGTINLSAANLTITQTGSFANTSTGTVTVGATRIWTVTGGTLDVDEGSVTGASGRLIVNNAAFAFALPNVEPPLTLSSTTIVGGAVSIPSGQTLTLFGGGLTDPLTVQNGGTLRIHGSVTFTNTLALPAGATVLIEGTPNTSTGALTVGTATNVTNAGIIELTSQGGHAASLTVNGGPLVNGGTIRSVLGQSGGGRTLNAVLQNSGTLLVEQQLTMDGGSGASENGGTVTLSGANLTLTQTGSFTNTSSGTVAVGAGRIWTVTGGTLDIIAGSVTGTSGRLIVNNATLAFSVPTVQPPLTLTNTTIQGGVVTIPDGQTLTLFGGGLSDPVSIAAGGTLLIHGSVTLSNTVTIPSAATVRIEGTPTTSTGALNVTTSLANGGVIILTSLGGHASSLAVSGGVFVNSSVVQSAVGESGGGRTLTASLQNSGNVIVQQPLTIEGGGGDHQNSGTIDLQANLTLNQQGTFTNQANGTVAVGTSIWTITGGTLDIDEGAVTVTGAGGRLIVNNATLAFALPNVQPRLTLNGTSVQGGSVLVPEGQTLTLFGGGLSDPVAVDAGAELRVLGSVTLSNTLQVVAGGVVTIEGTPTTSTGALTVSVAGGFTNTGLIELTSQGGHSASLSVTGGPLINQSTIHSAPGASGGGRTLTATLTNQGSIDLDQALTIDGGAGASENIGTIDLTAANLTLTQTGSFTNNSDGIVTLDNGHTWSVTGGTLDLGDGTVNDGSGGGRLIVTNATLDFTPSTVTVPLTLTNTTIQGGSVSVGDAQILELFQGALNQPISITSGGTLVIHGSVTVNTIQTLTGTLTVEGTPTTSTGALTVTNGFTNNGTLLLTSQGGHAASLTTPTLTNIGFMTSELGQSGGARTLTAQLDNQGGGFLDVYQALTINGPSAQHSNAANAYIRLFTGNLTITQSGTGQSFTNSGTIDLEADTQGNTLTVTGGPFTNNLADAMAIIGPGSLNVGTTFLNNGEVRPQGILSVTGDYTQSAANGVLDIQISPSGGSSCAVSHQLAATGAASLAGALNVFVNDCLLTPGQQFTIVTAGSPPTVTWTLNPPSGWSTAVVGNNVVLTYNP